MEDNFIPLELRKLGLKDKEVKVYLAGLELGPTPVQDIAKKAGVVRPTTYEIIKSLKAKGLFSETSKGTKRLFEAQSPEKILQLLRVQRRELEEKEREFIRVIAALESKYYSGERGGISVFHGEEGMKMLEEKISFSSTPEILVFASRADKKEMQRREEIYKQIKTRRGKIEAKELCAEKIDASLVYGMRKVFSSAHLVPGTLIIFDHAVFFPAESFKGYLIENQLVVELLKSLFRALWERGA
ncbi:MAG: hypothetical protein HYT49_02195 [Candidatus Wildermuthbacteria bacterium]|nr:hypothetical protein [Candidatus Wildermuthbacteria bacterium]